MALTKAKISEIIQELKSGGDPNANPKIHDAMIWEVADIIYASLVSISFRQNVREGDYDINSEFVKTFLDVPVRFDSKRNEYYSVLPQRLLSLPNNRGLRMVSPVQEQDSQFEISRSGGGAVYRELEADFLTGPEVYVESNNKIFYRKLDRHIKCVLIKMVVSIETLDEDDPIPIPGEFEEMFIDRLRDKFTESKATLSDKHNDSRGQETIVGG